MKKPNWKVKSGSKAAKALNKAFMAKLQSISVGTGAKPKGEFKLIGYGVAILKRTRQRDESADQSFSA